MTAHRWWRPQEVRFLQRFGYSHLLGGEVHQQLSLLNRLKPVDGALVIGGVQLLNCWTIDRSRR